MTTVRRSCSHSEGPHHNCAYVDRCDRLVPLAADAADDALTDAVAAARESREVLSEQERDALWTRAFHAEMQDACESEGLRRAPPKRNGVRHAPPAGIR